MKSPDTHNDKNMSVAVGHACETGHNWGQSLPVQAQLESNIAHYLSRVINRLNLDLAENMRALNISAQHYRVLQILYFGDGITVGELARRIVITLPVLSRVLDQMQQRDLLVRRPNPNDARYTNIFLTEKGVETYTQAWKQAHPLIDKAVTGLSSQQVQELLGLVRQIDANINK